MAGKYVSEKRYDAVKKKLATAYARNARLEAQVERLWEKGERQKYEIDKLKSALAQAIANNTEGGWARFSERQRIYIKALEERLAGTWNPADTHQQEYDAMYASRKAQH
jgi:predicted  nucleic acid-binding Zn-ribbon protein